jgi:hypothetical protein
VTRHGLFKYAQRRITHAPTVAILWHLTICLSAYKTY